MTRRQILLTIHLTTLAIFFSFIPEIYCQNSTILPQRLHNLTNCTKLQNNKCVSCHSSMYLYNEICIPIILHCKQYNEAYTCQVCQEGYILMQNNGTCILGGFQFLRKEEYQKKGVYIILNALKVKYDFLKDSSISIVFMRQNNYPSVDKNLTYYRIILVHNSGLLQALLLFEHKKQLKTFPQFPQFTLAKSQSQFSFSSPTTILHNTIIYSKTLLLLQYKNYSKNQNEHFIEQFAEFNISQIIINNLQSINLNIKNYTMIDTFCRIGQKTNQKQENKSANLIEYRIFIVHNDLGIKEISFINQIQINVNSNNNNNMRMVQLNFNNISSELSRIIYVIGNSTKYKNYLQNYQLAKVQRANNLLEYFQFYNITYTFISIPTEDTNKVNTVNAKAVQNSLNVQFKVNIKSKIVVITKNSFQQRQSSVNFPLPNITIQAKSIIPNQKEKENKRGNLIYLPTFTTSRVDNHPTNPIEQTQSTIKKLDSNVFSTKVSSNEPNKNLNSVIIPNPNQLPNRNQKQNQNQKVSNLPKVFLSSQELVIQPSSIPTNNTINSQLIYTEYINLLQFIRSPIFSIFRRYLQNYFPTRIVGSDLLHVSVGQNSTTYVFNIIYKIFNKDQEQDYYTFAINKIKQSAEKNLLRLQLVSYFKVSLSKRMNVIVDQLNRSKFNRNISQQIQTLIKIIQQNPLYSPQSKLYEVKSIIFPTSNSNLIQYTVKYFYPEQLGLQFEYIKFICQVNKAKQQFNMRQTILLPKQRFKLVYQQSESKANISNGNSNQLKESIEMYIIINVIQLGGQEYKIQRIQESIDRVDIYRVGLIVSEIYKFTYQIHVNSDTVPRLISNQTIERLNSKTDIPTNNSTQNMAQNNKKDFPLANYTLQFEPERLPFYRLRPILAPFVTINNESLSNNTDNNNKSLNQSELKQVLTNFYNFSIDSIYCINLIKKETTQNNAEKYIIDFYLKSQLKRNLRMVTNFLVGEPRRFIFYVSKLKGKEMQRDSILQNFSPSLLNKVDIPNLKFFSMSNQTEIQNPTFIYQYSFLLNLNKKTKK